MAMMAGALAVPGGGWDRVVMVVAFLANFSDSLAGDLQVDQVGGWLIGG